MINPLSDELRRLIESAVEGDINSEEQVQLMSLLARDESVRRYYAAAEKERDLLKKAMATDIEPPRLLKERIFAEIHKFSLEVSDDVAIEFQIKEPERDERLVKLQKTSISVGRSSEAVLHLEDDDVSRAHCLVEYRDGKYHIRDLDSRNGIVVNDVKVTECDLGSGDVIRLGSTLIKVIAATELGLMTSTGDVTRSEELIPAYITYTFNGAEGRHDIRKDIISIGRGTDVDVRIDSDSFSRRHCCIERVFDQYQLVDLGSTNGTMLNGTQALMEDLGDGDRIRVGDIELVFHNPAKVVEEELIPMGERTIMALMPDILKKPAKKLDPAVLEQRRARLQMMLEDRKESTQFVRWGFAAVAGLILLFAIGFIILKAMNPKDTGPSYNVGAAKLAVLDVRKLLNQNKYQEAIDKAEIYMKEFPGTMQYMELRNARNLCEKRMSEIDWDTIYKQAYAEFEQIRDSISAVKDDPIALNELYTDYKLWRAKYKDREEVAIRKGEKKPLFSNLIADAVTYSFEMAKSNARVKVRSSYFGEAITMLNLYKMRYGPMIAEYFPERWAKYLEEVDAAIETYTQDAKDDFEYNWSLAEFYIRENMIKEALECLNLIIRYGIPEYTQLARARLANIDASSTKPVRTVNPDGTAAAINLPEKFTESESDRLVQRYAFADALKYLEDYKSAMLEEAMKLKVESRIEEVKALKNSFDWLLSTYSIGGAIDLGGGLTGKVKAIDNRGITITTAGGGLVKKWDSYKPREIYGLFSARDKKAAHNKTHFFDLAVFCLEFNMRSEALTNLTKAYRADEKIKDAADILYARYSHKPIPKGGFIVYKGHWLTPDELEVAKLREAVDEAIAALGSKDVAVREKAFKDLETLADKDKSLVVSQLTVKLQELLEEIKKSPVLKAIETVDKLHDELRKRRAAAIKVIFDKTIYPDENHGAVGQPTVDEFVNKVREIYKTPIKDIVGSDPKLAGLVMRAREIQECLSTIDFEQGEGFIDLDALLEALNNQININTTLNANEMRIYTYSMKIKEYNELLTVPGKRTKEEKIVVRLTNEYRLMMGLPYLRIDRLITKAGRVHSFNMCKRGFFAHDDPVDGTSPFARMRNAGYNDGSGENIARGMMGPDGAFMGWYNSSGHHRNILSAGHTEIGVGVYDNFWTQDFGKGGVNVEDEPDNANIPNCGEDIVDG